MHHERAAKREAPPDRWAATSVLQGMRAYEDARKLGVSVPKIRQRLMDKVLGIGTTGAGDEVWNVARLVEVCADLIAEARKAKTPSRKMASV